MKKLPKNSVKNAEKIACFSKIGGKNLKASKIAGKFEKFEKKRKNCCIE